MWMNVVVVDQSAVNTDQIIPGEFLNDDRKEYLAKGLFANLAEVRAAINATSGKAPWVLLARDHFGSGSSREHAVWALQGAGCVAVVAQDFARIFRRNAVNGGLLPIALPKDCIEELIAKVKVKVNAKAKVNAKTSPLQIRYDVSESSLQARTQAEWNAQFPWDISPFERFVIDAGGLLDAMTH